MHTYKHTHTHTHTHTQAESLGAMPDKMNLHNSICANSKKPW